MVELHVVDVSIRALAVLKYLVVFAVQKSAQLFSFPATNQVVPLFVNVQPLPVESTGFPLDSSNFHADTIFVMSAIL